MLEKCAWTERLENVLNDYDALQQFQMWMGIDDDSSEHPLRLYFAIIAYRDCCKRQDFRANKLAHEIYNKFLRHKTGLCAFINLEAREEIEKNLLKLSSNSFVLNIFDPCISDLYKFLRRQHALFIESQEFIDFYNLSQKKKLLQLETNYDNLSTTKTSLTTKESNTTSDLKNFVTPTKLALTTQTNPFLNPAHAFATMSRSSKSKSSHQFIKLTPSSLLRSQRNRENILGQSSVEKLYKPICKYPYIGQATTSTNDSSVSSSFSSEANNSHHSANMLRYHFPSTKNLIDRNFYLQPTSEFLKNEQRRLNPTFNNDFLRLNQQFLNIEKSMSNQFDHLTEEGRIAFVNFLTKKLQKVIQMREMNKAVEKFSNEQFFKTNVNLKSAIQINNLNLHNIDSLNSDDKEEDDEEDEATHLNAVDNDVDNYFCSRMVSIANDSSTLSSQQQTPPMLSTNNQATEVLINCYQQSSQLNQVIPEKKDYNGNDLNCCLPEQKLFIPQLLENNLKKNLNKFSQTNNLNLSNNQQNLMTKSYISSPLNQNYLSQNSSHLQQINFYPQKNIPKFQSPQLPLTYPQHDCCTAQMAEQFEMSQSCNVCSKNNLSLLQNINLPKTQIQRMGFAPPPGKLASDSPYQDVYYDNDGDTSGIGTLTYISDASRNSDLAKKQRAAMFKKARKLNEANASNSEPIISEIEINNTDETKQFVENSKNKNNFDEFTHLNLNSKNNTISRDNLFKTDFYHKTSNQIKNQQKITVVYRQYNENNCNNKPSVPIVAHVILDNNKGLTLKEFKRLFLISSKEKIQFFFRTVCEDGSAPYQLLLVNNDSTVLPIFEEKITAECRCLIDSD